jgi:hypothetical protein
LDKKTAIKAAAAAWLFTATANANGFQYFEEGINFWGKETKQVKEQSKPSQEPEKTETSSSAREEKDSKERQKFDWQAQLDPAKEEFFREGEYIPPAAFMELVRNPTDQNIRMWFSYVEKKNALAERLAQRMQEYTQGNQVSFSKEAKTTIAQKIKQLPIPDDDFERYRFRMYFDSTCPHCQKMFATLNDLQDRGYFVEARQVDRGSLQHIKSVVPIVAASSDEVKKFNVSAVPLLLVGDLKNKSVYKQTGFATPEDVLAGLRAK